MSNPRKTYHLEIFLDSSVKSVRDFLFADTSRGYQIPTKDFLLFENEAGLKNIDSIFENYTDLTLKNDARVKVTNYKGAPHFKEYEEAVLDLPIALGTQLFLELSKIERDLVRLTSNQVVDYLNFNAFLGRQLALLLKDKGYSRVFNINGSKSQDIYPNVTVWIWSRVLSQKFENNQISYDDKLINVTPFIQNLETSVNSEGGTFSFTLPPLTADLLEEEWKFQKQTVKGNSTSYLANSSLYRNQLSSNEDSLKRNDFYFERVLSQNDIVFVRFETLSLESEDRLTNVKSFEIPSSEIQFKNFDMIGLIDNVSKSVSAASTDVSINIQGRDIMKLFIEDGNYFYPLDTAKSIFANETREERLVRFDGKIKSRFQDSYKTIDQIIKFVINALSTVQICSDTLFNSYSNGDSSINPIYNVNGEKDRRSYFFDTDKEKRAEGEVAAIQLEDIKKRAITEITKSRESDEISLKDKISEEKAALEVFNELYEFLTSDILKIYRTDKTRPNSLKWLGGWKYKNTDVKTANDLPLFFDKKISIFEKTDIAGTIGTKASLAGSTVNQYVISQKRSNDLLRQKEKVLTKGIWQIVKLVLDDSVKNRRVTYSELGNEQGSIINSIKTVCQEPFVEFFGDTYGDQYYLVVRKPPFDESSIKSFLKSSVISESVPTELLAENSIFSPSDGNKGNLIIDIDDNDIINENLSYSQEAYSWYKLELRITPYGQNSDESLNFFPAVYFEEYANIFGSKPYDKVSNYLNFLSLKDKNSKYHVGTFLKQAAIDMKYMVDTMSYLPFSKQGSITINGDRRIKRGTWIRLKNTGEIAYVDAVSHNYSINQSSIDRITTLGISRCLREEFIDSKNKFSYFNIINTDIDESAKNSDSNIDFISKTTAKWRVNKEVFNFFVKQRHYG